MRWLQILCGMLLFSSLYAQEKHLSFNSVVDVEGIPSATVGNVNVITGDFCDGSVDLVLPGPEPLKIERSYLSSDFEKGSLFYGWNLNHFGKLIVEGFQDPPQKKYERNERALYNPAPPPHFIGTWKGGFGAQIHFKSDPTHAKIKPFYVCKEMSANGMTNVGRGEISGRTNLKNNRIEAFGRDGKKICHLYNGAGDLYEFTCPYYTDKKRDRLCLFTLHRNNGLYIQYKYQSKKILEAVELENANHHVISNFKFVNEKTKNTKKITVSGSDNRYVKYHFSPHPLNEKKEAYLLNKVEFSDGSYEKFVYFEFIKGLSLLSHKKLPDGRYIEASYYRQGKNTVGEQELKVGSKRKYWIGRVSEIKAPIGSDATPRTQYIFTYDLDHENSGSTLVFDALNHLRVYRYQNGRLKQIKYHKGTTERSPHTFENFYWGQPGASDEGNLIGHSSQLPCRVYEWCRGYRYDTFGNILEEHFAGNLTGANEMHPCIDAYGFPADNGCEKEIKRYTYLTDGRNLLSRAFGTRNIMIYEYYESSELPYARFHADLKSQIKKRQFFFYDINKALTKEIIDNGSGTTDSDFTNVTQRIIRTYKNTMSLPVGLPEEIVESYFDFSEGGEKQLSRTVKEYSIEGWCLREDLYDANDGYVHSKFWEYDLAGRVTKEINPLGETIERRYDLNGNKIFEQGHCKDFFHEFVYDFSNRLIREELVHLDGRRDAKRYEYNLLSQKIAEWDIRGNVTQITYDDFGNIASITYPAIEGEEEAKEQRFYNTLGHLTKTIDSDGETHFWHTSRGQQYAVRFPDGSTESQRYNIDGTLRYSVAKDGTQTHITYDYADRPCRKEICDSQGIFLYATSCTYDAFNILTETDAGGNTTFYSYNNAGQLISVKKEQEEVRYEYDACGRQISIIEMTGSTTAIVKRVELDLLNRPIKETIEDEAGNCQSLTETHYDRHGNKAQIIHYNANGPCITHHYYDAYQRLIQTVDPNGNLTRITYDDYFINQTGSYVSSVTTIDPRGYKEQKISDARGREVVSLRKEPFDKEVSRKEYRYDPKGRIVAQLSHVYLNDTVERLDKTLWRRDPVGNVVRMIEASETPLQRETQYFYSPAGQKVKQIKPDGKILFYSYDSRGRLQEFKSEDETVGYRYTYDILDNPIDEHDFVTDTHTTRIYNPSGKMQKEVLGNGLEVSYEYDYTGRVTTVILPDRSSIIYEYQGKLLKNVERYDTKNNKKYGHHYSEYDLRGCLLHSILPEKAGEISYTYDACGKQTEINTAQWRERLVYDAVGNIVTVEADKTDHYAYDDNDQLTKDGTNTYSYDSINNRRSKNGESYTINELNQITNVGKSTYVYDLNGNRTAHDSTVYRYDALDRLIEVEKGLLLYRYQYDATNRRLSKQSFFKEVLYSTENYLYLNQNEVGSYDVEGKVIDLRILGLSRGAEVGATIAVEKDKSIYYPVHDHQGSIVRLLKSNGGVYAKMAFTPFGELKKGKSPIAWSFSSKRYDPETECFYFGRRYYDPTIGRWLTVDPIGHGDGPNVYAYVHNNPSIHFDEYGLFRVRKWYGYDTYMGGEQSNCYKTENLLAENSFYSMSIINGINTNREDFKKNTNHLGVLSGGMQINCVYNATHGVKKDVFECAINLAFDIATSPVQKLIENWDEACDKLPQGMPLYQGAHSQGTIHVRNALRIYNEKSPERSKRIMYFAFGSAAFTDPSLCRSSHHYISMRDCVWIFDAFNFLSNREHVTFLTPAEGADLFDHAFTSPTNEKAIEDSVTTYKAAVDRYFTENPEEIQRWSEERKQKESICQK